MSDTAIERDTPTPAAAAPTPPSSGYETGVNYMLGRAGVTADLGMAAASFLDAADANDPRGMYAAGMMYLKGVGLSQNTESATSHLQSAAAAGHAPARKVLEALAQGKNMASYPIVIPEQPGVARPEPAATAPVSVSVAVAASGTRSTNPVTAGKVLAIVVAVIALIAGAGGGVLYYNKAQADKRAQEQAQAAEQQRQQAEAAAAAERERQRLAQEVAAAAAKAEQAEQAVKAIEGERQRMAEQQAKLQATTEALQKQQEAVAQAATAAAQTQARVAAPEPAAAPGDVAALVRQAAPRVRAMLDAALADNTEAVVRESNALRALPQPQRGDRRQARNLNTEALNQLKREEVGRAVSSLTAALAADPADEEIATNLGYAMVKDGKPETAQAALTRALLLNPSRSSAWYNLGLSFVAQNKEPLAYASFLLTFRLASNQQKSREWFERTAQDESNPPLLRRLAQKLLGSTLVASSGTTAGAGHAAVAATSLPAAAQTPARGTAPTADVAGTARTATPVQSTPAAPVAATGLSRLQEFCGGKSNFVSRGICESRECPKPENRNDPYCTDYFKRSNNP